MAAFGCNFEGDIAPKQVVHMVRQIHYMPKDARMIIDEL